jgi:hypothetical protein
MDSLNELAQETARTRLLVTATPLLADDATLGKAVSKIKSMAGLVRAVRRELADDDALEEP